MEKLNIKFFSCLFTLAMLLFSGSMMAQTFNGAGNPQAIPTVGTGGFPCTGGPTTSAATVAGLGTAVGTTDLIESVTVNLTHTWDSDIEMDLISPDGTVWDLTSDNGGAGDNYTNTVFQDGFPSITTGAAPFTGTFQAEQGPFATGFAGDAVNGNWTLSICDDAGGDTGTLLSWSITFVKPCVIDTPADVVVDNDPGVCGANVTLIATAPTCLDPTTNDFTGGGLDASGLYPVGTTTVTWTSGLSTGTTTVTVNDTEAPTMTCPGDQTIHLDPGACDQVLSYDVLAEDNCPSAATSITTNNDLSVGSIGNSVGCPGGGYQTILAYDLAAFGITSEVAISSVDFGIFQVFGSVDLTVNVYTAAAVPAANAIFNYADLTLVGTGTQSFGPSGNAIGTMPMTGSIPAGSVAAIVELVAPNGTFVNRSEEHTSELQSHV